MDEIHSYFFSSGRCFYYLQVQESSFNADVPLRTWWLLLHYSSTQDSFHTFPPAAPAVSHSLVIFLCASFICFHSRSPPHHSPSIIHSTILIFGVMSLPKAIVDLVPPDKLAVLFIWQNSRAAIKVFTSLEKKTTCFLLPDFDQELSGITSLEPILLSPLFHVTSVESPVALWNCWGVAVPFASLGSL